MDRRKSELDERAESSTGVDDAPGPSSERARELLSQGESLFESGRYEQAIHVWTRVLFVERRNTRALALIENAKRAYAEKQRTLDAKLDEAGRLLDEGRVDEAKQAVRSVLAEDPRHGEGHQLAERIELLGRRTEPLKEGVPVSREQPDPATKRGLVLRVPRTAERPRAAATPIKMAGFVLAAVLVLMSGALYLRVNWDSIVGDDAFRHGPGALPVADEFAGPLPDASELRYYNGARLYAKGRYREALAELSAVERDSTVAELSRSLMLRIEERLLRDGASSETRAPAEVAP